MRGEHRLALGKMRHRPVPPPSAASSLAPASRPRRSASTLPRSAAEASPPAGLPWKPRPQLPRGASKPNSTACLSPALPERVAVNLALGRARHERRALSEPLILGGAVHAASGHRRLDLRAAGRERLNHAPRNACDLEAPVRVRLLDAVSQPGEVPRELVPVHCPEKHLGRIEPLVRHRAPRAVRTLHHVGDHRVGVEGGIQVARRVVAEGGDHRLLTGHAHHAAGLRIPLPGLRHVRLEPVKGARDRPVMGLQDPRVAADKGREGHRLGGGEREVTAGTMFDPAVLARATEAPPRSVRHLALENRTKDVRIDPAFEAQLGRAPARPRARGAMLGVILRVVAVALVVGCSLGRRGHSADRRHHVRSPRPGDARGRSCRFR